MMRSSESEGLNMPRQRESNIVSVIELDREILASQFTQFRIFAIPGRAKAEEQLLPTEAAAPPETGESSRTALLISFRQFISLT
jgi:hypothetical protein